MSITKNQLITAFVNSVQMVAEFHSTFGHPVGKTPYVALTERRAAERLSYLTEELQEGLQAALAGDRIAVIDALADAIYFSCGSMVECGVFNPSIVRELAEEVLKHEDESMTSATEESIESCDSLGWERFMRNIFVGSMHELSGCFIGSVEEKGGEVMIDTLPNASALAMAYLAIIGTTMDADPLAVMEEVHRSNMSKLLPAELDSESACRAYMEFNGCKVPPIELKFERLDDMRWIAKHMSTNKIIKNPLYSEADLAAVA